MPGQVLYVFLDLYNRQSTDVALAASRETVEQQDDGLAAAGSELRQPKHPAPKSQSQRGTLEREHWTARRIRGASPGRIHDRCVSSVHGLAGTPAPSFWRLGSRLGLVCKAMLGPVAGAARGGPARAILEPRGNCTGSPHAAGRNPLLRSPLRSLWAGPR